MFSSCSKQALCIKVLPLLFTAATPPARHEGAARTETDRAAGIYVCVCVSSNRAKLHVPNICSGHNIVKCTQAVTVSEVMVLFF